MTSERVQRQIDRLLDEAEQAMAAGGWDTVRLRCDAVLALDPANADARFYLDSAARAAALPTTSGAPPVSVAPAAPAAAAPAAGTPQTFDHGRYEVMRFLGEGGRKKVYLARDKTLDRQVAFALIKTEGLDEAARERITREAQTMGRLGNHPNLVTVFDIGEHTDEAGLTQPWIAIELLPGGDVEGLLKKAAGPLALERTLQLAQDVCRGLVFLHSKGFVHRDLKPGNVWLTADGTAKIGDYGLAMSADHTRLTLQGTMVGTVDYMPPEQALGGDINARSDLYSLGAMLYELVTGKPPFQGERIAEVISQHINVVPVAPSERGAEIPLALEELILQLLHKDPARRPGSAAEVARALEAIDPLDLVDPLDPDYLARRAQSVFVGRSRELEELRHRFDEVLAGQSRIVMLVGQPGIGKTRLAQELEGYARSRGARVFWGRAPEGGGAPEYWLFHQMLRRFLEQAPVEVVRERLGDDAPQLARIAPEIRERLRGLPEAADSSEFALFEAMRTFVHRLAEAQPLVLVLDDLHWADAGSLALLQHASRDLQRARVLILGTYRDTEMSRTHPLSQALATLNREQNFFRVAVRSLGRDEVSSYIEQAAGFEPTREQLDLFMRETDGNPFFLSEIVAGMLERRTLDDRTYELEIPDGMREALARRVNALNEDAVELLKLAAVIGYEFDFATLSVVSELDDDRELKLVEEALEERVIAEGERPGTYRFVYQPMQRLLLDEISSTRQLRLHGQVGELLEASFGASAEQHASVLAPHFAASAQLNPAHRDKAVRYLVQASQQAEADHQWEAARRTASEALDFASSGGVTPDLDGVTLLVRLARAEIRVGNHRAGYEAVVAAFDRCRDRSDGARAAEVALEARRLWSGPAAERDLLIARALELVAPGESLLRARLLAWRSEGDYESDGQQAAEEAARIAPSVGAEDVQRTLAAREATRLLQSGEFARGFDAARSVLADYRAAADDNGAIPLARLAAEATFWAGDVTAATEAWAALVARAESSGDQDTLNTALARQAALAHHRADWSAFEAVVRRAQRLDSLVERFYVPRMLALRGRPEHALARFRRFSQGASALFTYSWNLGEPSFEARLCFAAGRDEEARSLVVDQVLPALLDDSTRSGQSYANGVHFTALMTSMADDALPAFADRASLAALLEMQWETNGRPLLVATMQGGFDRIRASWALALGRLDEARRLVERGLDWSQRERLPVEEGRCQLLLSDVLREQGETREAARHLDAAGELFQRTGARLYLDQVLERRDLLKA